MKGTSTIMLPPGGKTHTDVHATPPRPVRRAESRVRWVHARPVFRRVECAVCSILHTGDGRPCARLARARFHESSLHRMPCVDAQGIRVIATRCLGGLSDPGSHRHAVVARVRHAGRGALHSRSIEVRRCARQRSIPFRRRGVRCWSSRHHDLHHATQWSR